MTKRQTIFIIVVNAAISLVISLSISLIMVYVFLLSLEVVEVPVGPGAPAQADSTALPPHAAAVTPSPKPTTTTYIVQAGDSLSGIAFQFDVSVEDIIRANGLTDADLLFVGQELIIPIGGLPETPAFTPVPTPTETPIPFEPPTPLSTDTPLATQPTPSGTPLPSPETPALSEAEGPALSPTKEPTPTVFTKPVDVEITEIVGSGNIAEEIVIITNQGQPVNLEGWTLSDRHDNAYTFPGILLWSNYASVRVHTSSGENTATDLYWKLNKAIWEAGDKATLVDRNGKIIAVYALGD
ncbi:MAG: LysM peptidoglycan-binding domain-containing protein [Anaerolineales bacterium]|nr:MAG: LysM peptidoglycan-binding domain-containing protein [Anaerolineales bacterium]